MSDWNSALYLKFRAERTQPAIDLAKRIDINNPKRIIDIGCGPGNSTHVLASQFAEASVLGVDNSMDMIEAARKTYPAIDFQLCDASKDLPAIGDTFDIVFSNACIQWIPNHHHLLPHMMGLLREGGTLAIQTPMNTKEPIHQIILELVASQTWAHKFSSPRIFYNLSPGEYFDLLSDISSDFTIWETTYFHRMSSHQSILEWYRGTGLRPYLNALSERDRAVFEKDVLDEVVKAYPIQKNGEIIFRFPRLFLLATK